LPLAADSKSAIRQNLILRYKKNGAAPSRQKTKTAKTGFKPFTPEDLVAVLAEEIQQTEKNERL